MRRKQIFIFIIVLIKLYTIKAECIPGENCPLNQGYCNGTKCICLHGFDDYIPEANKTNPIYCNYRQINRDIPFVLEFFFPGVGLFYLGQILKAVNKLTLFIFSIFLILFGLKREGKAMFLGFLFIHIEDLIFINYALLKDKNGIKLI